MTVSVGGRFHDGMCGGRLGRECCSAPGSRCQIDTRGMTNDLGSPQLPRCGVDNDGVVVQERAEPMGPAMHAERGGGGDEAAGEGSGASAS